MEDLSALNSMLPFLNDFAACFANQWVYVFRILLACVCGGAIGIERTLRQKDAGFRTHIIVAAGSALFIIVSKYGFFDVVMAFSEYKVQVDVSRIASGVVTGISFLGAGMIFANGANIKGLTTAAGVWATAAVGLAIGAGLYTTAIVSTVLIIVVQIVFHTFLIGFDKVLANDVSHEVAIRMKNSPEAVTRVKTRLGELGVSVVSTHMSCENDTFVLLLNVKCDKATDLDTVATVMQEDADVLSIAL